MMGALPPNPRDLALLFSRMDDFSFLVTAPVLQWKGLIGRQGNAGMRPDRRIKSGMDGGLRAAFVITPSHHLTERQILSNLWGPPQHLRQHIIELNARMNPP